MNRGQFLVLWVGIMVAVAMCLYPPQMEVEAMRGNNGKAKVFVESAGYDFIFADNEYIVNVPTLLLQLGIVAALTALFFITAKRNNQSKMSYTDRHILAQRKARKSPGS